MQLDLFRTLWGVEKPLSDIAVALKDSGFTGVEARIPTTLKARQMFAQTLKETGLDYIAVLFSGGDVIPDQAETPEQHLMRMAQFLTYAAELNPRFVNVLAGNDRWPLAQQVTFFGQALELAKEKGVSCCFETHRGSALYSPWVTLELIRQLPELQFTMDISHWVVVCERLLDSSDDDLDAFIQRVGHIQARVGYDQGAQVPHPAAPEYQQALAFHQSMWEAVWQVHLKAGHEKTTMTTEFGPDGYLHHLPFTDVPVADLWSLNDWIAAEERRHFDQFMASNSTKEA